MATSKSNKIHEIDNIKRELFGIINGSDKKSLMHLSGNLIQAVLLVGDSLGYKNYLDKYRFREVMMADTLNHLVPTKSRKFSGDAVSGNGVSNEYKTVTLSGTQVRKLFDNRSLTVSMVYNDAFTDSRIDEERKKFHFVGLFHRDDNNQLGIGLVDTSYIVKTLTEGLKNWVPGKTTNLNTVKVEFNLDNQNPLLEIVYLDSKLKNWKNSTVGWLPEIND